MAWDYAPAPESRDVVSIRSDYGLFIDGEFVEPSDGGVMKTINVSVVEVNGQALNKVKIDMLVDGQIGFLHKFRS